MEITNLFTRKDETRRYTHYHVLPHRIGKLCGDSGLFDIVTESDVYTEGTAQQILHGKQLARGVRSIKLTSKALFRLFWKAMQSWLKKEAQHPMTGTQELLLRDVQHAFHANDKTTAKQLISELETDLTTIQNSIQMVSDEGVKQSANFAYRVNFLKGANLLLSVTQTFNST